jgi:hypothetical protein
VHWFDDEWFGLRFFIVLSIFAGIGFLVFVCYEALDATHA